MRMQSICHPGEVVNIASAGQGIHGKTLDATDPPPAERSGCGLVALGTGSIWVRGVSRGPFNGRSGH